MRPPTRTFSTLTANPDDLIKHIAQQVHANAGVAQRKYRWAEWAIRAVLVDLVTLSAVAGLVALHQ